VVYEILKYFLAEPPVIDSERWEFMWLNYKLAPVTNLNETKAALENLCYAITESHEFQIF